MTIQYLKDVTTLEQLKKLYKKLALKLHPDAGGSEAEMKKLNAEYDFLFEKCKNIKTAADGTTYKAETVETPEEFKNIINELIKMNGITVEIIGCFLWISGDTKPHKEKLKELKFRWHNIKSMWFFSSEPYKRKGKELSIEDIRHKYGSEVIHTSQKQEKLEAV